MSEPSSTGERAQYRVGFQPKAFADLEAAFDYILTRSGSAEQARQWLTGLLDAGHSLERFPNSHGYARENGLLPYPLRQLIYGAYRLIYSVDEDARYVRILRVRHAARRSADRHDLE